MMKTKHPLISVIVPIYNVGRYLSHCIESIINQDYQNIEIILVNDGSSDDSSLICKKFSSLHPNKIIYIYQQNSGCSSARNMGVSVASGDWVSFVDGDDLLPSTFYAEFVKNMPLFRNDMAFIFCGIKFHNINYPDYIMGFKKKQFDVTIDMNEIHAPLLNSSCNKLFPREQILNSKINFPLNTHFSEDMAFVLKSLAIRNKALYISSTNYVYNIHPGGITSKNDQENLVRFCQESIVTYTNVKQFYKDTNVSDIPLQLQIINSLLPDFYARICVLAYKDKNLDFVSLIKSFESMLHGLASPSTENRMKVIRYKCLLKILVFRHLMWFVVFYRKFKAYFNNEFDH